MFADFVEMFLTRFSKHTLLLESSHSLQNVARFESL